MSIDKFVPRSIIDHLPTDAHQPPGNSALVDDSVAGLHQTKHTHRRLRAQLTSLDGLFPIVSKHELGPYVHWKGNARAPMHRWLRYREAYSPDLIDKLSLGRRILDPFSGCGSIPIGAATRGKIALGVDLNPIAAFSSNVQLSPLSQKQLIHIQEFARQLHRHLRKHPPASLPKLSIAPKVFEPEILDSVLRARTALEREFVDDKRARDFVFLAWLSVLETVGSYFKEGNGIKYRNKKRSVGRYESRPDGVWQLQRFGPNQREFYTRSLLAQLQMMLDDTAIWLTGSWERQTVVEGSAFELRRIAGRRRFDSVVFSPPYANRFDYFESFKVELWFGNFVNSYEEHGALRKASLRSHLNADFRRPVEPFDELEELIQLMDKDASSWRMGVADLMRGYFHDIRMVLEQCRDLLPHGRCHVVVGNSAFAGVIVPTDCLTAMVGMQAGFRNANIIETRHLTVSPQQRNRLQGFEKHMRESIVVLET